MARKPQTPSKPDTEKAASQSSSRTETQELRERIERLEESILGDDGLAELDHGIDKSQSGDALQKAVNRSNIKRGSRKA